MNTRARFRHQRVVDYLGILVHRHLRRVDALSLGALAQGYAPPNIWPWFWRTPIGSLGNRLQCLLSPHVVVMGSGSTHLAITNHILKPQFVRVYAHLPGNHIGVRFHRERHLGLSRRPIGTAGHVVGVDHIAVDLKIRYVVLSPGSIAAACQTGTASEAAVCSPVVHYPAFPRHECSVVLYAGLDGDHGRMSWVAGHQLFDITHNHLYRPAAAPGQEIGQRNVHRRGLTTEVAADTTWVD